MPAAGFNEGRRVSVGLEDAGDLLADLEADPNASSILLNPNYNEIGVATDFGPGNYWAIVLGRIEPPGVP